jgi:hypothetical protein
MFLQRNKKDLLEPNNKLALMFDQEKTPKEKGP